MNININNLSESQINTELLSRHSRTSGSIQQKRDRLQRFLEFEDQKQRRNEYVQRMRQAKEEEEVVVDECYDGCPCTYGQEQTQEERVARVLMDLRDDAERSEYYINHLIPRVKTLEDIVHSMEKRISELETADMPALQDSNPNWVYDETSNSPYAWECTKFN
jgi:hypothetical protein